MTELSPVLRLDDGLRLLRERGASLAIELSPRLCKKAHEFIERGDLDTAVKLYRWAVAVAEILEVDKQAALCSHDLAELLERAGSPIDAVSSYRAALDYYYSRLDLGEIVPVHTAIARCYVSSGDSARAIAELEQAESCLSSRGFEQMARINFHPRLIELLERAGHVEAANVKRQQLESTNSALALVTPALATFEQAQRLGRTGRVDRALRQLETIRPVILQHAQPHDQAAFLLQLGGLLSDAARFDESTECLQRAIALFASSNDVGGEAKSRKTLASNLEDLGQYQDAIAEYRAALRQFSLLGDRAAEGRTRSDLGVLHKNLNLYVNALRYYLVARSLLRQPGHQESLQNLRANLDTLFSKLRLRVSGRFAEELERLFEGGDLLTMARLIETGVSPWRSRDLAGRPEWRSGRRQAAQLGAGQLLLAASRCLASGEVAQAVRETWAAASTLQLSGSYAQALEQFRNAEHLAESHGLKHDALQIKQQLGACLVEAERLEEARDLLGQVVSECKERDLFPVLWQARLRLADVHSSLREHVSAVEQLRQAVAEVENRAGELKHVSQVEGFLTDKLAIHGRLVELLVEQGDSIGAYDIVLCAKCWPFVRFAPRIRRSAGSYDDQMRSRIKSAVAAAREWAESETRAASAEFERHGSLLAEWEEHRAWTEICEESWTSPEGVSHRSSTEEAQAQVGPESLLLDLFFTEKNLHLFTMSAAGMTAALVSVTQHELWERLVRGGYRDLLEGRDYRGRCLALVRELTADLLAPFFRQLDLSSYIDRVCVCPHGILHLLPISGTIQDFFPGTAVWQIPHASFFRCQLDGGGESRLRYVALANPEGGLSAVREEIEGAAGFFDADRIDVSLDPSTRQSALDRMRDADILHFACHAARRADASELSFLELGSGERLRVVDILARGRTRAKLVLLSACSTSLGRVTPSDEVGSLSRAFLHAGAQAVVATLWPIPDRQTSPFIIDFFRLWRGGEYSLRTALMRAKAIHLDEPWVSLAFELIEAPPAIAA